MSRRNQKRFYCPKCGQKKLVAENRWDRTNGHGYHRIWVCQNQPPKRIKRLLERGSYQRDKALAAAELAEAQAYSKKHPPCDCVIQTPGRDAEIIDFGCVLDLLIRTDEAIKYHLFETDPDIHQKGFQVLYSSDVVDVARLRDKQGVACYLYWKHTWEPDYAGIKPGPTLTHTAASYLTFKPTPGADGIPLPNIFRQNRVLLWTKDRFKNFRLKGAFFEGTLGKKKKAEIVEWVKSLERQLPQLMSQAAAAHNAWIAWGEKLKSDVAAISNKVNIRGYDQIHGNASITIDGWLLPEQIKAIAEILDGNPVPS